MFSFQIGFGQPFGKPDVDPLALQATFVNWNAYQSKNIMLSRDFIPVDITSNVITKEAFLQELLNGNTIPIRLLSEDDLIYYKLYTIEKTSDSSITATSVQIAFDAYENLKKEYQPFPKFSFMDLKGTLVTNETMKGKIVVIKCWYIHCAACIKEFPEVNALVEKYKNRNDIIFLSLAEDTAAQLNSFLQKKPLSYLVVPNMKKYMNETLHLNSFPTHFILTKEGMIAKVLPDFRSLEVALEVEMSK